MHHISIVLTPELNPSPLPALTRPHINEHAMVSTLRFPSKMHPLQGMVLNTFTSFDAPSRDVCGWSMHCACAALARRLHDG